MNGKKRIAISMVASIISFIVNVSINMVLTPYLTAKVGKEIYGYVNLAFQVTGYVTIITTALNAMLGRYVIVKLTQKDYKSANMYFTSVTLANMGISLILMIPSIFFILFLDRIIRIPSAYIVDVKILWAFIIFGFMINLLYESYGGAVYIGNRLDLGAKRGIESNLLKALILVGMYVFFAPKVWYIGMAIMICGIYIIITNIYYMKKLVPEISLHVKHFRWSAVKELVSIGAWNSVAQVSQSLISGLDMIITNIFIGAIQMTLMGFAKAIPYYILTLISLVSNNFSPMLSKVYATGDMKQFVRTTHSAMKVCGFICSVPVLGFVAYGSSFFHIWLPTLSRGEVTTVEILSSMILLQTIFDVYIYPLYTVDYITCNLKIPVLVNFGIGVGNLIGTLILLRTTNLGVYAVQIVSSSLLLMRVFMFAPLYAAYILNVKWSTFYKPLFRGMLATVIVLPSFYFISRLFTIDSWFKLSIIAIISAIFGYIINFIIILDKKERIQIQDHIFNKFKMS